MEKHAKKAYDTLVALGVPVVEFSHYGGHFQISAEEETSDFWLDYYDTHQLGDFGIHKDIHAILDKNGLFAEWADCAIASIHDA